MPASYCEGCWREEGLTAAGRRDHSPSDSSDPAQVSPIELIPLLSLLGNGRLQGLLLPKVVHFWSEIFMTVSDGCNLTICKDGRWPWSQWCCSLRTSYMHRPLPKPWESPRRGIDFAQFAQERYGNCNPASSALLTKFTQCDQLYVLKLKETSLNPWSKNKNKKFWPTWLKNNLKYLPIILQNIL